MPRWGLINKALGLSVPEPVETYSSSPHLFEELDIPEGTKGRLPRDKRVLAGVDAEVLEDLGETGKKPGRGGARDSGRDNAKDGARGAGRDSGRTGGRDTRRSGSEAGGRSGDRRRRTSDSSTAAAPAAEAAPAVASASAPAEVDRATRARRRTRTRRRNGEVVAGGNAAQDGAQRGNTEA